MTSDKSLITNQIVGKLLLTEYYGLCEGGVCQDLLTEAEKRDIRNNKSVYLTGIMQRADAENGNGRIYPYDTLKREIDMYQRIINENRALGECDHPESELVELKNASHMVTRIWWNNKDVMGTIKVLSTPSGKILEALVRDGVQVGISSRGLGTLTETNRGLIVEDDFELVCFDVVSEPSTSGAFMKPQMLRESKARYSDAYTKADAINRMMLKILQGAK